MKTSSATKSYEGTKYGFELLRVFVRILIRFGFAVIPIPNL